MRMFFELNVLLLVSEVHQACNFVFKVLIFGQVPAPRI